MSAYLSECEGRLRDHFSKLRGDKSDLETPVFAIEHPLEKAELDKLRTELTASLRAQASMSAKHKLCWIVQPRTHRG